MRGRAASSRRALAFASAMLLISPLAKADDAAPAFDLAHAREVTAAMDKDPALAKQAAACPADIFRQEAPLWRRWLGLPSRDPYATTQKCEEHPEECYKMCSDFGNAANCFHLALALQRHEADIDSRFAQMMYAKACALGYSGGCTNRGAHMRNVAHIDDESRKAEAAAQDLCQYRSFKLDCEDDEPWGCAMLGQAYQYGEGVGADAASARKYYGKACTLAPNFVACDFSKSALKEMSEK